MADPSTPPATECQHNWICESTLVIKPFQVCAEEALVHYSAPALLSTAHNSSPEQGRTRLKAEENPIQIVGFKLTPAWTQYRGSVSCPVHWNLANWKLWKCDLVLKTHPVKWNQYQSGRITSLLKSLPPPVMDSICFWGYFYQLRCFRSALELHFHWKDFISIINEVRNDTHSSLVQNKPPHARLA